MKIDFRTVTNMFAIKMSVTKINGVQSQAFVGWNNKYATLVLFNQ